MGNQGMTNWKFSAFFAIALILIAGVFASTAIATDGAGTIEVIWDPDEDSPAGDKLDIQDISGDAADEDTDPLDSASVENEVKFTYTVPAAVDMSGGSFRLVIPSGFTVSKGLVTVSDGTNVIYDTIRDGKADSAADPAGPQEDDNDSDPNTTGDQVARDRVKILPVSGATISSIEVTLAAGKEITIQFSLVTAPVPSRLPFVTDTTDARRRYEEYQFTAYSKKKGGTLTRLKPVDDPETADVDESAENPQPFVRVGNAASGTGAVTVTPTDSYEKETGRDYRITYTAAGPMYNSVIRISVPDALIPDTTHASDDSSALVTGDIVDRDADNQAAFIASNLTVSQRGGVNFGEDPAFTTASEEDRDRYVNKAVVAAATDNGAGTITIFIDDMGKGDQVRLFYENITVRTPMKDANRITEKTYQAFEVFTDTDEGGFASSDLGFAAARRVGDPAGKVHPVIGSGTVTIEPSAVNINVTRDYTVSYTAKTALTDAWLVVNLPPAVDTERAFKSVAADGVVSDLTGFTATRVREDGTLNYGYIPPEDNQTIFGTDSEAIKWEFSLSRGSTFRRTIRRMRATNDANVYQWGVHLLTGDPLAVVPDAEADSAIDTPLYVLQADDDPDAPDVTFVITDGPDTFSAAAIDQTIAFTFTALSTPIKDGNVSFSIPSGWSPPTKTNDVAGDVTVSGEGLDSSDPPAALDDADIRISGMEVTINIGSLAKGGTVVVTYTKGMIQRNADEEVEINSYFKPGKSLPERVSTVETVTITNVDSGSGTATISPTSVEAGSTDNKLTVRFSAQGSMDGGHVRFSNAADWGAFQGTSASGANYIKIDVSSGGSLRDTAIGDRAATAYFDEFGYGDVITFTLDNAVAQPNLGIANFKLESAGRRGGNLYDIEGEKRPEDADTPIELLGKVYISAIADVANTDEPEDHDGLLRVEVGGGGDGSGTVDVAIVSTKAGPAEYDFVEDGEAVTRIDEQVHAGDDEIHLRFTYKPIETIADGELKFTVPAGWTAPQANSSRQPGYTDVDTPSGGSIGSVIYNGAGSLTVPIYNLETGQTIVIDYGDSDGGAVAPTVSRTSAFDIEIQGSEGGSLDSISTAPTVMVRPQASGRGTTAVDTDGDVHAGDTGRTITVTYTAVGQIVGGMLKVTVPLTGQMRWMVIPGLPLVL